MRRFSLKAVIVVITLCFTTSVFSAIVSKHDAEIVAKNFYFEKINAFVSTAFSEIVFDNVITQSSNGVPVYYVFERGKKGFIIISADDAAEPVLGYSFDSPYPHTSCSPAFSEWMDGYKTQITYIRENSIKSPVSVSDVWAKYLTADIPSLSTKNGSKAVAPLLSSTWTQGIYYNTLCPRDFGGYVEDGRDVVGCVATAMAQIMYYYRYPAQGVGSHSYSLGNFGTLSANFGTANYDYNSMSGNVTNYSYATALLNYHCGVAVNMQYDTSGSGAQTQDAANASKNYFKYSSTISYQTKNSNSTNWANMLTSSIDLKRPVLYSGSSQASGGHAFVCDGYLEPTHFHFNWGWGGYGDGYFYTTALNPVGNDFNQQQAAVFNIFPATTYPSYCTGSQTLTARFGSFDDGSGNQPYQNNSDCSWLIAPPNASNITLTFNQFNTEANNDVVNVYNGSTTASPLLGSFSGSTLPAAISSTAGTMLVTFKSNASTVSDGFLASYSSNIATAYCSNIKLLTTPSGTITDGSGTNDYNNNTNCKWYIYPTGATSVTLQFTDFNIENSADLVEVYETYNSGTAQPKLLGSFSGSNLPPTVSSQSGRMQVFFYSDNRNTGSGWTANYNTLTGIESENFLNSFSLYPNPASDKLNFELNLTKQQDIQIQLYAIDGSLVASKELLKQYSTVSSSMDISNVQKGIYIVKIIGETGSITKKLVVK